MKASELIYGGLYLIHDASDVVVMYDITSNSFRSEWYEYPLALFHNDVCATDGDRYIFVKPIPLTPEILKTNGFEMLYTNAASLVEYNGRIILTKNQGDNAYYFASYGQYKICIMYVHELQRVLRCCGLSDLADNFKIK